MGSTRSKNRYLPAGDRNRVQKLPGRSGAARRGLPPRGGQFARVINAMCGAIWIDLVPYRNRLPRACERFRWRDSKPVDLALWYGS